MSSRAFPELDAELLATLSAENAAQRRIRVSWSDRAAWARSDDALNEENYPYKDVLPLRW